MARKLADNWGKILLGGIALLMIFVVLQALRPDPPLISTRGATRAAPSPDILAVIERISAVLGAIGTLLGIIVGIVEKVRTLLPATGGKGTEEPTARPAPRQYRRDHPDLPDGVYIRGRRAERIIDGDVFDRGDVVGRRNGRPVIEWDG
jgi:hypothetical protein